ncbi:MAG TPA: hypothetical protein VMT56_00470 [Candidatus Bathyarchaeia archaeon]|nr:hypothetical protein [Candidatus Bathyarchaeia archaeon]
MKWLRYVNGLVWGFAFMSVMPAHANLAALVACAIAGNAGGWLIWGQGHGRDIAGMGR